MNQTQPKWSIQIHFFTRGLIREFHRAKIHGHDGVMDIAWLLT